MDTPLESVEIFATNSLRRGLSAVSRDLLANTEDKPWQVLVLEGFVK
jgi:hypothetical protein